MEKNILDDLEMDNEALSKDIQKKLSDVIEKYKLLSDEEKEEFHNGAFDVLKRSLSKSAATILPTWLTEYQSYLFIFAILIVIFFLAIITRKLYKRTKERENRKEIKRKLREEKAMKKKKKN